MGEPCDRVALPASGRVLDEVPLSCAIVVCVREELPNDVELVVAGPDLALLLFVRLVVLLLPYLCVVLKDVRQALPGEDLAPEVVGVCLLYTSPSPRDRTRCRMPSSAWKKP